METTPNIKWHRAVAGSTEFTFVGDYKIVKIGQGRDTRYLVQRCEHGMPVNKVEHMFDYLDDALSWIGA